MKKLVAAYRPPNVFVFFVCYTFFAMKQATTMDDGGGSDQWGNGRQQHWRQPPDSMGPPPPPRRDMYERPPPEIPPPNSPRPYIEAPPRLFGPPPAYPTGFGHDLPHGLPLAHHHHPHHPHSTPPFGDTSSPQSHHFRHHGTIYANPNFDARRTAERLHKAMRGVGCDKEAVLDALCTINNEQRQFAAFEYKKMYGEELVRELKRELSGELEQTIIALMDRPDEYDANTLRQAMKGFGADKSDIVEILVTRRNAQIDAIISAYHRIHGSSLEKDIAGETKGTLRNLLISLCNGARDETCFVDPELAHQDALQLLRDGEMRKGVEASTFNKIFATQNFDQLRRVFAEYEHIAGYPIESAIESEFANDRDTRMGLMYIAKCVRSKSKFFAEMLHNAMKGRGTRDADLIRIIVSRSEIDLADIQVAYEAEYRTSLEEAIAKECKGAYQYALLKLLRQ